MKKIITLAFSLFMSPLFANAIEVKIYSTQNTTTSYGHIHLKDTPYGLLITPHLNGLPEGLHGLHVHENPSCANQGADAGGHFDPQKTNTHQGPYQGGHLGDLPALYVNKNGDASTPILAPKLKIQMLEKKSIIIHAKGDNYSDNPSLGGGETRIACGIILP
jgi:Cu-Zn family superoxide dismutase